MKFCLLSTEPDHPEKNHINNWATIMGGTIYNGPFCDQENNEIDYDYFDRFDLIMVALRQELIDTAINVTQRSKAKTVIFLDREVDYYTTHTLRDLQAKMVELLNIADAVAVIHDESIELFETLTCRPVGLVGLPFPLERVRRLCPPVQKQPEIELGSVSGRNALFNLTAMAEIGMPCVVDMQDQLEMNYFQPIRKYVPFPPIRFRQNSSGWDYYMTQANYSLLGLHLDCRYAWGRLPVECAALRMPCVAPPSLFTQKILFPDLCVTHHDIQGAVTLVNRLVSNAKFYEEAVSYAESQLKFFSYEETKKRLFNLIS
ncbi:MAG: hypothetical protein FH756_14360 [Firmicutes bacterium]|nr:hypothetical protein [Bacillota bacterium]